MESNHLGGKHTRRGFWKVVGLTAAVPVAASAGLWAASPAQALTPGTWYYLKSRHSGLVLDVLDLSTANGAEIIQYNQTNANNQQFRFIDSGDGYYRVQARHSNKVLDVWEWNPDNGATIAQYDDLNATNQQWRVTESGGYATLVNRFSGKALDVWEWSTSAGSRISQYDPTGEPNQQWQLVPASGGGGGQTGLVGWATQNGGTTGGGNAAPQTVTSASALVSAMSGNTAKVIRVSGTINLSGMNDVGSNTTIIGNAGARITGGGLDIDGVSNVIVQNLTFDNWSDDAINIQDGSTRIWIDHNTFGTGHDGACDVKRGSDFVTVSWNRFNGTDKTCLLGHSDSNGSQDRGHLRVTYHHNYFNGTNQRTPRVRFGNPVHVYNNYYRNIGSYCVATTQEAGVIVEGNYFENCNRTVDLGQGSSPAGSVVSRNNHVVNSPNPVSSGSVGSVPYSFQMDTPSQVASIVSGGAGAR
ncbi:RICIN domain-containing protein [Glycomyces sp. TRM65418]|uniref:pectate lyase family protein n=1 Tax=Glycomyces sp. TRM65418 TaxID=2867006 RepID=UPI001CE4D31A|nr:RICIN domain-containing protein [Glycomyces sp. TRM65418]MCC3762225.1 RICIN domain-containing protein [Glycomyces sp. TRM65418]QZD56284.1 RICIN domain-containing protein [Glycomyces sp. TRM65418]